MSRLNQDFDGCFQDDYHKSKRKCPSQRGIQYSRILNVSVTLLVFPSNTHLFGTQFLGFSTQRSYTLCQFFLKCFLLHCYSDLSCIRNSRVEASNFLYRNFLSSQLPGIHRQRIKEIISLMCKTWMCTVHQSYMGIAHAHSPRI